jgi:hypothetical protein
MVAAGKTGEMAGTLPPTGPPPPSLLSKVSMYGLPITATHNYFTLAWIFDHDALIDVTPHRHDALTFVNQTATSTSTRAFLFLVHSICPALDGDQTIASM